MEFLIAEKGTKPPHANACVAFISFFFDKKFMSLHRMVPSHVACQQHALWFWKTEKLNILFRRV